VLVLSWKGYELKTVIVLYMLVLLNSAASAEVYTWEDANGLNFSDNSSSIPEWYREKPAAETRVEPVKTNPQARVGMYPQNRLVAEQEARAAVHLANREQHRLTAEAKKQQQANSRDLETTLQSLVRFVVIWVMLGLCLFVIWIATLVDIVRSKFPTPASKAGWLLVVLFLPLLGMVPYLILGADQKCNPVNCREKQPLGVDCPVRPG